MSARDLLRRWTRPEPEHQPGATTAIAGIEAAARSHVGKVRQINEDRFLVRTESGLWAVADGMGGHAAGGEAADAAIAALADLADADVISPDAIRAALDTANQSIRRSARGSGAMSGTTVVVALVRERRLTVLWAGDSRAYLLRDGASRCVTRDHSMVQELIDAGAIRAEDAERHPQAHLITRALGAADTIAADAVTIELEPGDRLLLCSDGVSRSLDITRLPGRSQSIAQLADSVLNGAIRLDGSDNATLVAVAFDTAA